MRLEITPKITYDDVLIKPMYSDIISREKEIDISVDFLGKKIIPIISSNMDYVTGIEMIDAMESAGALGVLNRFETTDNQIKELRQIYGDGYSPSPFAVAVGIRDFTESIDRLWALGADIACIDVAHGDHLRVLSLIKAIQRENPRIKIIAGNVATAAGVHSLIEAGADAIKVGIGPGSVCTTREVTGCGVPQLSAVIECVEERDKQNPNVQIIADGGINSSGDIVKALAAGADAVMLGRLLAGHDECPGEKIIHADGRSFKPYRGQSMLGANGSRYAPEGISGYVPARGPVEQTIKTLVGGIKSGLSYVGARNISELREKVVFQIVSSGTKHENNTRVLQEV